MNKKYFKILFTLILSSLLLFNGSLAAAYSFENTNEFLTNTAQISGYEEDKKDISVIVANIIKTILTLVGALFAVLIIYGGFVWMTSGSNADKVAKAKKIIIYSIIGLLIILTAYSITYFIASKLSGENAASQTCADMGGQCSADCGMWGTPSGIKDCGSGQVCCIRN